MAGTGWQFHAVWRQCRQIGETPGKTVHQSRSTHELGNQCRICICLETCRTDQSDAHDLNNLRSFMVKLLYCCGTLYEFVEVNPDPPAEGSGQEIHAICCLYR